MTATAPTPDPPNEPEAPAPPPPRPFDLLDLEDIDDPGPTRWLVAGLWQDAAFGVVGALPKSWKSYLSLQLALSVATGERFLGRFDVDQRGRVLIFSAEGGARSVRRRIGALSRALGVTGWRRMIKVINLPILRLDDAHQLARLQATVEMVRPVLVILDPLRELHELDENDSSIVAKLLAPLRAIGTGFATSIMLVHHNAKPGEGGGRRRRAEQLRGTGALGAAFDSGIFLETFGEGEGKRAEVTALHRDATEPDPFMIRMAVGAGDQGEAIALEIVAREERDEVAMSLAGRQRVLGLVMQAVTAAAHAGMPLASANAVVAALKGVKGGGSRPAVLAAVKELTKTGALLETDAGLVPGGSPV